VPSTSYGAIFFYGSSLQYLSFHHQSTPYSFGGQKSKPGVPFSAYRGFVLCYFKKKSRKAHFDALDQRSWSTASHYFNAGALRLALRLFPATRRVVVVTGARDKILPYLQYAKKAFAPWKNKLQFEYTNKVTDEQMLHQIAHLAKDSIIIYAPYFTDTTHRSFLPADVVERICRSASAPVFSTQEYFLGSGIVGGSLLKTEQIGEKVAEITVQYLKGRLKLDKPITSFSTPPQLMLDGNALVRWKVAISSLPKGCTIVNRPVSLWENNKSSAASISRRFPRTLV
jgi:hypothetical protein